MEESIRYIRNRYKLAIMSVFCSEIQYVLEYDLILLLDVSELFNSY